MPLLPLMNADEKEVAKAYDVDCTELVKFVHKNPQLVDETTLTGFMVGSWKTDTLIHRFKEAGGKSFSTDDLVERILPPVQRR